MQLMPGIFNRAIFNDAIFNTAAEAVLGGKGDNDAKADRRRRIFKPTGLVLPRATPTPVQRVDDSREIAAEVAAKLAREFTHETEAIEGVRPIAAMSLREIDSEIGTRLRQKLRTEEDELILLMLMAATAT